MVCRAWNVALHVPHLDSRLATRDSRPETRDHPYKRRRRKIRPSTTAMNSSMMPTARKEGQGLALGTSFS